MLDYSDFAKIMSMGIELSTENDRAKVLEGIIKKGMEITHCDVAALYLYEEDTLQVKITRKLSDSTSYTNMKNMEIKLPPIGMDDRYVCAYTAMHHKILNIPDVYQNQEFDFKWSYLHDEKAGYHTKSMLVIPIENNENELLGVLQMINALDENGNVIPFAKEREMVVRSLGSLTAISLTNIRYVDEMKRQLHSFVEAMSIAIDARTPYNGTHTRKVAEYALLLADKMNEKHNAGTEEEYFDEERKEKLELAALLHDIGKMVIPRSIMNRATRLDRDMKAIEDRFQLLDAYLKIDLLEKRITDDEYNKKLAYLQDSSELLHRLDCSGDLSEADEKRVQELSTHFYEKTDGTVMPYITEYERQCLSVKKGTLTADMRTLMQNHVTMTGTILDKVYFTKYYEKVPKWAVEHHEFLDGSGYPNHLTAKDLDLEARILTVSDIYDALTSRDRPYKKPLPKENAIEILKTMAKEGKVEMRLVEYLDEAIGEILPG